MLEIKTPEYCTVQTPYSKTLFIISRIFLNLLSLSCREVEVVKNLFLPLGNERLNYKVETDTAVGVEKNKKKNTCERKQIKQVLKSKLTH